MYKYLKSEITMKIMRQFCNLKHKQVMKTEHFSNQTCFSCLEGKQKLWTFVTYKAMMVMSINNLQLFDIPSANAEL